jgi:hypothetical protein
LLEIDSFGDRMISVRFAHEHDAHALAEEFANANVALKKVADKMQRNGFDYVVR